MVAGGICVGIRTLVALGRDLFADSIEYVRVCLRRPGASEGAFVVMILPDHRGFLCSTHGFVGVIVRLYADRTWRDFV